MPVYSGNRAYGNIDCRFYIRHPWIPYFTGAPYFGHCKPVLCAHDLDDSMYCMYCCSTRQFRIKLFYQPSSWILLTFFTSKDVAWGAVPGSGSLKDYTMPLHTRQTCKLAARTVIRTQRWSWCALCSAPHNTHVASHNAAGRLKLASVSNNIIIAYPGHNVVYAFFLTQSPLQTQTAKCDGLHFIWKLESGYRQMNADGGADIHNQGLGRYTASLTDLLTD